MTPSSQRLEVEVVGVADEEERGALAEPRSLEPARPRPENRVVAHHPARDSPVVRPEARRRREKSIGRALLARRLRPAVTHLALACDEKPTTTSATAAIPRRTALRRETRVCRARGGRAVSAAASSASPRSASNEAISARVAPRSSNRPSRAARTTAATVGTAATAICADRGAERASRAGARARQPPRPPSRGKATGRALPRRAGRAPPRRTAAGAARHPQARARGAALRRRNPDAFA